MEPALIYKTTYGKDDDTCSGYVQKFTVLSYYYPMQAFSKRTLAPERKKCAALRKWQTDYSIYNHEQSTVSHELKMPLLEPNARYVMRVESYANATEREHDICNPDMVDLVEVMQIGRCYNDKDNNSKHHYKKLTWNPDTRELMYIPYKDPDCINGSPEFATRAKVPHGQEMSECTTGGEVDNVKIRYYFVDQSTDISKIATIHRSMGIRSQYHYHEGSCQYLNDPTKKNLPHFIENKAPFLITSYIVSGARVGRILNKESRHLCIHRYKAFHDEWNYHMDYRVNTGEFIPKDVRNLQEYEEAFHKRMTNPQILLDSMQIYPESYLIIEQFEGPNCGNINLIWVHMVRLKEILEVKSEADSDKVPCYKTAAPVYTNFFRIGNEYFYREHYHQDSKSLAGQCSNDTPEMWEARGVPDAEHCYKDQWLSSYKMYIQTRTF